MRILIPIGSRAEMGLSAPIIAKLGQDDHFQVSVFNLIEADFGLSYKKTEQMIEVVKPDMALIVADRIEMTGAAAACYQNRVPFAHYFAGIFNHPISTLDDINRHCISLWSDIQLAESLECAENVRKLFDPIGKPARVYSVGITHLEDLSYDDSLVPEHEYYLVLYNPVTNYSKEMNEYYMLEDLNQIYGIFEGYPTIIIYPNNDPGTKLINEWFESIRDKRNIWIYRYSIPRPQFHSLLKNCSKFISNSSATSYEAPYFLEDEQIVRIGLRNMNRSLNGTNKFIKFEASKEIVEVLRHWEP